jgi:hypothetical protein
MLAKPVAQLDRAIGQPNPYTTCHCPTRSGNPETGSVCSLDHPVKPDDDLEKTAG